MGKLSLAYQASETEVKKVATTVKPCGGTTVSDYFVTHTSSWQSHLDRISRYLVLGEGVWWTRSDDGYKFYDADNDPNFHDEGPPVRYCRSTSIEDVFKESQESWKTIVEREISIPCAAIRLFDEHGDLISIRRAGEQHNLEHQTGFIPLPIAEEDMNTPLSEYEPDMPPPNSRLPECEGVLHNESGMPSSKRKSMNCPFHL